ncbi:MAG: hypothetical protein QOF18_2424 [Frankiaceae bacterium]|jgi:hypothetical protein|nr:hypothetical protein [Frankiaceae bacterium]
MSKDQKVMMLLAARVPIALLLDLATPPDASELYATEGGDADWLLALSRGAA